MPKSIYSYNGSSLHLKMDDLLAENYNRAMDAWFQSQRDFEKLFDRKPKAADIPKLLIVMTDAEHTAWNIVSAKIDQLISEGLVLTESDCPSSYLVKL